MTKPQRCDKTSCWAYKEGYCYALCSHPAKSEAVLEELRKHFVKLYDDGFKDPLVTFDAAISMMKYGDTKLRQQER